MEEEVSAKHESAEEIFPRIEAILRELRTAVTAPPPPAESWMKRSFRPAPAFPDQGKFNLALINALAATLDAMRASIADQEARFERVVRELEEARMLSENLDAFRERSDRLEAELHSAAANTRGLQERAAALEGELAQAREQLVRELEQAREQFARELTEAREQLARELTQAREQFTAEHGALASEMRERIQHLLDEQRVCIRQLSLQASEEAVLADRARRAAELKVEELAKRLGAPPA